MYMTATVCHMLRIPCIIMIFDCHDSVHGVTKKMNAFGDSVHEAAAQQAHLRQCLPRFRFMDGKFSVWRDEPPDADIVEGHVLVLPSYKSVATHLTEWMTEHEGLRPPVVMLDEGDLAFKHNFALNGGVPSKMHQEFIQTAAEKRVCAPCFVT